MQNIKEFRKFADDKGKRREKNEVLGFEVEKRVIFRSWGSEEGWFALIESEPPLQH